MLALLIIVTTIFCDVRAEVTPIVLGYKPTRPFYAGSGEFTAGPLIPPGTPWPSKPMGYADFNTTLQVSLEDAYKETTTTTNSPVENTSNSNVNEINTPLTSILNISSFSEITKEYSTKHNVPDNVTTEKIIVTENVVTNKTTAKNGTQTILLNSVNNTNVETDSKFFFELPFFVTYPTKPSNYVTTKKPIVPQTTKLPLTEHTTLAPEVTYEVPKPVTVKPLNNNTEHSTEKEKTTTPISLSSTVMPTGSVEQSVSLTPTRPNRPSHAGSTGGNLQQIIKPGKPWPARPEDYAEFSVTNTPVKTEQTTFNNQNLQESNIPSKLPPQSRPPFAGSSGAHEHEIIKPGKPWPARPEDYEGFSATTTRKPNLQQTTKLPDTFKPEDSIVGISPQLPIPNRPSFAGITGGSSMPQNVHENKPDATNIIFGDELQDASVNITSTVKPASASEKNQSSIRPPQNRPSFAGSSGGIYHPQIVKPGQPWPARPEDYEGFSATTTRKPNSQQTTKLPNTFKPEDSIVGISPQLPIPNRPSFAGITGGSSMPQNVQENKPDATNIIFGDELQDMSVNISSTVKPASAFEKNESSIRPPQNRPSFVGSSGGIYHPQIVKPGKPWPARPEDYGGFSVTNKPITTEQTTFKPEDIITQDEQNSNIPSKLPLQRPPFAGSSGSHEHEIIKPGKPWPARPEDYEGFSATTTQRPNSQQTTKLPNTFKPEDSIIGIYPQLPIPNRPSFAGITGGSSMSQNLQESKPDEPNLIFGDEFQDTSVNITSTMKPASASEKNESSIRPPQNRPSFSGSSGGIYHPQIVKPGKPWPARPEDYGGFSATNKPITTEQTTFKTEDIITQDKQNSNIPSKLPLQRPPFAGSSGSHEHEIIKPGKPWPARPEDYEGFSATTQKLNPQQTTKLPNIFKPEDSIVGISPQLPIPNRPSFAGITGGSSMPQNVQENNPDVTNIIFGDELQDASVNISSTVKPASAFEKNESSIQPPQNRPSFSGSSGGIYHPQIVKPGKPWPARPEDYGGFSVTNKPITTKQTTFKPEDIITLDGNIPSKLPLQRPPFAGSSGSHEHEIIKPGKPWPARPEDYEGFSATTTQKPNSQQTTKLPNTFKPEDSIVGISLQLPIPNRPSFAGITGGSSIPQNVQENKPDATNIIFGDELQDASVNITSTVKPASASEKNESSIRPPQNRPSFSGSSGGIYHPQIVKPGKPWPARPADYGGFSVTNKPITTKQTTFKPEDIITQDGSIPSKLPLQRPPFAGSSGSHEHEIIKPGKPWPARPEDYEGFSATTTQKPNSQQTTKLPNTFKPEDSIVGISPQLPIPNRPSFAGITGGSSMPQNVQENNPDVTNIIFGDELQDASVNISSTVKPASAFEKNESSIQPPQNRPSFSGSSGGIYHPQIVKPGKPWPAKPEDYGGFSVTNKPITTEHDIFKPEDIITQDKENGNIPSKLPLQRPPFAGSSGAHEHEIIKPGKPWPARPEDYEGFSATATQKPNLQQTTKLPNTFKPEDSIVDISPQLPIPNRPSFAGITGGSTLPQNVQENKPDTTNIIFGDELQDTSANISSTVKPASASEKNESSIRPPQNRPSFAGSSGGIYHPQIIKPGKPWPSRPEDYEGFSATTQKPESQPITTKLPNIFKPENSIFPQLSIPNRPSFAGSSGGSFIPQNIQVNNPDSNQNQQPTQNRPSFSGSSGDICNPQIIKPGKPWPARPEDYEGFSATERSDLQQTTTMLQFQVNPFKPEYDFVGTTQLPIPNMPSFAGITGGSSISQGTLEFNKPANTNDILEELSETTVSISPSERPVNIETNEPLKLPSQNRPSFSGSSGGIYFPPVRQPGKPWPAKQEVTDSQNLFETEDSFINTAPTLPPNPDRPFFAGITGGNFTPQVIKSGTPWPARPKDDEGFVSTQKPGSNEFTTKSPDGLQNNIINTPPGLPNSNLGGNYVFQSIQESLQELIKPNNFSTTLQTTVVEEDDNNISKKLPTANRPFYAGITGGNYIPQLIKPGTPWPARADDYEGFSATRRPNSQQKKIKSNFINTTTNIEGTSE